MFGLLVVDHRRRLGLTQEELAGRAGISVRTIRELEAGRVQAPRPASARLLADAFGLEGTQRDSFVRAGFPPAERPAVHCLPRPATHFRGRAGEVARLLSAVDRCRRDRPLVVAVDGMAGVGKTALVLEVAHQVADRYPGAQLFVDLHGHSTQAPVDTSVALGLLLGQLGVPAGELPDDVDGRVARWRTELAGARIVVVLDNVAGSVQVRPLLPGLSSALVLVTSRRRLVGLDADEHVTLDPLDESAAVSLLAGVIGAQRMAGQDRFAQEVAGLCGNLPLALSLTAARLRYRPSWTVADLAERLRNAQPPVVELAAEGMTVSAALTLSYRQLTGPAAELLRRLGLHSGEDFDEYAAAALTGGTPATVGPAVEELLDGHLLHERGVRRYRLHDLVRDYAGRLAAEVDEEPVRRAAVRRLLEYYLHSMVTDLPDGTVIDGLHTPGWGTPSSHRRVFASEAERTRWEEAEWRNVLAAIGVAERFGMDRLVCLLARAVWGFHWRRGNAGILITVQRAALAAAQRLGDLDLTAMAHNYLAGAHARCGQMAQTREHIGQALELWRATGATSAELLTRVNLMTLDLQGGRFGEVAANGHWVLAQPAGAGESAATRRRLAINRANALRMLGECHTALGEYGTALHFLRRAACHREDLGGEGYRWAFILFEMGRAHARLGHRSVAPLLLRRALAHFEAAGNETGVAEVLAEIGLIHLHAGELGEARRLHESAVRRTERAGSPQGRCLALNRLGGTVLRAGDVEAAAGLYRQALDLAERIDARYEEAVAHAGLAAALAGSDPAGAARHGQAAERLYAVMSAVDPYHVDTCR
jgi:tetratricopeptide (TPR) repeat protein/transcriptional regulator with XRE-family HTH domain